MVHYHTRLLFQQPGILRIWTRMLISHFSATDNANLDHFLGPPLLSRR